MLSEKFELLVHEFPEESKAIENLHGLLASCQPSAQYTLTRLIDKLEPSSTYMFPYLLNSAVSHGVLEKVFRVESPSLGGIKDFASMTSIPDTIYDWHQDKEIDVMPEYIKLIFKPCVSE